MNAVMDILFIKNTLSMTNAYLVRELKIAKNANMTTKSIIFAEIFLFSILLAA